MRKASIVAIIALSAFLVSCGTSGGADDASSDPTETTAAPDGTTAPDEGDQGDGTPADVSAEDLESILPVAADIGPDYFDDESDDSSADDTSDDSDDPMGDSMTEACPELAALDTFGNGDDENPDEVTAKFTTDDDRGVEVSLDPTPNEFTKENVDTVIDALSKCGTIETSDEASGMSINLTIEAEELSGLGDYGVAMTMQGDFTMLGFPLEIDFEGNLFSVNGVLVSVSVSSGLDQDTFEPIPGDYDLLEPLSAEMASRVASVTD